VLTVCAAWIADSRVLTDGEWIVDPALHERAEEAVSVERQDSTPVDGDESTPQGRVDEVTAALEDLREVLSHEDGLAVVLNRMCLQAVQAIPGATMASISLLRDGDPTTVAVTGEHAIEIDKAQYSADEGPCLEAAKSGEVIRVTVPELGERWPAFVEAAGNAAVASYLSAPLFVDRDYHGSLNLYGDAPHAFDGLDAALLELYTTAAEAVLQEARRHHQARETTEHLRRALSSRAVIDQAKGALMAARGISADEAFALLVKQSQDTNVRLHVVAERLLAHFGARPST
jgi:transcriptional regulator with GAF, ATPase, and Fis domain